MDRTPGRRRLRPLPRREAVAVNTGGGFVFKRIRREWCAGDPLPDHCFGNELAQTGGAWLDAPDYFPAGSVRKVATFNGGYHVVQTCATREDF